MRTQSGFTLLELMVTIVIGGILLAVGLPSMNRFALKSAESKAATELLSALVQARSEAVARNATVTICRRDFYTAETTPRCAADGGSWSQGWIVYQDADATFDASEPDASADIVAVFDPVGETSPTGDGDTFAIVAALTFPSRMQFLPSGRAGELARFTVCESTGSLPARQLDVEMSGRATTSELSKSATQAACAVT
ncbi:MAG TPA: GspH/FimT family pseudopilin [Nevskiaceae bacterium]|nr:GspH/FimT family pseudopilin [Nevskiaceae bacterium]